MKNIKILTIVDNINYGTYLQAYATYKVLSDKGWNAEVINYIRPYLSSKQFAINYIHNKKMSVPKRLVYAFFYMLLDPLMKANLKRFLSNRAKMSKPFRSLEDFKTGTPCADAYLTGSDQVWNNSHNHGLDEAFFWPYANDNIYSYAASIGLMKFKEGEEEAVKRLLSRYKTIAVRESFGVDAVKKLGFDNVVQVLDPTLLITGKEWIDISNNVFKKTEPYLLIYTVEIGRKEFVVEQAQEIAKKRGLKVYVVCPTCKFKKDFKADRVFNFARVELFLSLFAQADFVVVSSFHGTAFSINFNKQFVAISPAEFSSRVNSLLALTGLSDRYIKDDIVKSEQIKDIDYARVNEILDKERKHSFEYIDIIK